MTQIVFARQSASSAGLEEYSGERLLNCYAQSFPDGGVGPFPIVFSPGLDPLVTLSAGSPVRAVMTMRGAVYAVCGGGLWVSSGGTATRLGGIPDDEKTTMASNGQEIAVAAGGRYFVWDGASITSPATGAFSRIRNVAALDGYILVFEEGGERFSVSRLIDAKTFDALDFASAESAPDYIVKGHVDHSELWLFGTKSVEIWQNVGAGDFPFARISGGKLDRGAAFANGVASEDNSVMWVGDDRIVYRANGYQPSRISTHWVERILNDMPTTADVRLFTYTFNGMKALVLRLADQPALVFDASSGLWHERGTGDGAWIATCSTGSGADTVLGTSDGRLCRFGGVTDGGAMIVREGVSLPVTARRDRINISMVQLNFRTTMTAATVMLQCSRDGRTYSNERWRPMGGQYDRLIRWFGWGQARRFQWRFRITDPIDGALYGATYE